MAKELLQDLAHRAAAARQYSQTIPGAGVTVHVRLPTSYQLQIESQRSKFGTGQDDAALLILQRKLLLTGVVGWDGVLQTHIVATSSPDPLDHTPAAVELLLDAQPDWEAALGNELIRRLSERLESRDAAAKN